MSDQTLYYLMTGHTWPEGTETAMPDTRALTRAEKRTITAIVDDCGIYETLFRVAAIIGERADERGDMSTRQGGPLLLATAAFLGDPDAINYSALCKAIERHQVAVHRHTTRS